MSMNVACYAAGIIGTSWATTFALNKCNVKVYLRNELKIPESELQIRKYLELMRECGCNFDDNVEVIMSRIKFTTSVKEAVFDAEFIQESGPENLEAKQMIVDSLDQYAPKDCIIASSTSGLKISDIVAKSKVSERYIGAHPFNPPHLIPLVEITSGDKTADWCIEKALKFYKKMKKEPILLKKEKIGFVANRISHAVLREVINLVDEGVCSVDDVDRALVYGLGLRWASIGQMMIGEIGTKGGTKVCVERFGPLNEMIFKDLENRIKLPDNWGEIAAAGIEEEKKNLPEFIGHSNEEISRFRDKVLVEVLKLHKKI